MNKHFLLLFAIAATTPAFAASLPARSNVSAVTVYSDRAVVTRAATFELPVGTHDLVFEGLPYLLADQSLQVSGRGTAAATILDTTARQSFVEAAPNDRIRGLEEEIRGVLRQMRILDDRATVIADQRDYVKRMLVSATSLPPAGAPVPAGGTGSPRPSLDEWRQLQAYSEEQLGKFAAELQSLDRQREDLAARRTALDQQLAQLRGAGGRSQKTVTVRVDATTAGNFQLNVSYTVPQASWVPAYDARLRTATRSIELSYFGVVRQNTGEDWTNVALTLSTARPSLGGAAPELPQWIVTTVDEDARLRQQKLMESRAAASPAPGGRGGGGGGGGRGTGMLAADAPAVAMQEAVFAQAAVDVGATSATFRISTPATIPANNSTQKVAINTTPLAATLQYNTTPKLREAAFLVASAVNSSEYPLLAGQMSSFLDETFIATSTLKTVMPGEKFDLALGSDDGIAIKRRIVSRFTETTGLSQSTRRVTYELLVTVTNNKRTPEKITLREPLPVSRNEQVVVKLLTPAEREIGSADRPLEISREPNGGLAWKFDLQPGGKREIALKFSVEHPIDLPVAGVE